MNERMKYVIAFIGIAILATIYDNGKLISLKGTKIVKIVGGHDTDIQDVPYQLSLQDWQDTKWSHICGASIILENVAVTAAHCVDDRTSNSIRLLSGSDHRDEGTPHAVKSVTVHPQYNDDTTDYDIAVIVVKDPFIFSDSVKAIPLAKTKPQENAVAIVSGWGRTKERNISLPYQLQSVEVLIVGRDVCRQNYGESSITDNMICAGFPKPLRDSCTGDSGGPLAVNGELAGIVSWGYGCAKSGYPGVYTNVAAFADWINTKIQDATLNK